MELMFEELVGIAETAVAVVVPGDVARTFGDDEVTTGVCQIERARTLLDAIEGVLLAELEARCTTDQQQHGMRTTGWVAKRCNQQRGRVAARLDVGMKLRTTLRDTEAALAAGQISWDHARVLCDAANPRIATGFAGPIERELLTLAQHATFRRWTQQVRHIAELLDEDGGYDPTRDETRNRLTLSPGLDGAITIDGQLIGLSGETVRQAIERVAGELLVQMRRDHETTGRELLIPAQPQLRAMALVELIRRATVAGDPGKVAPQPEVSLIIRDEDINPDTGHISQAFTPEGARISGRHLCTLGCNMDLHGIVLNGLGVPLMMGRTVRTPTRAQRRALSVRDGGCVFPGCDAHPHRCHAHHLDHWLADLGHTNVDRMILLCAYHHGVVHRNGWAVELDDRHRAIITTPNGTVLHGQQHGTTRTDRPEPRAGPAPPGSDVALAH